MAVDTATESCLVLDATGSKPTTVKSQVALIVRVAECCREYTYSITLLDGCDLMFQAICKLTDYSTRVPKIATELP